MAKFPNHTSKASTLEIALSFPFLPEQNRSPRSGIYFKTQKLIGGLYKLNSIICAQQSIDVEDQGGVNVRILLLDSTKGLHPADEDNDSSPKTPPPDPITDLPTLVRCNRPWTRIFSLESEEGETLLKSFEGFRSRFLPRAKSLETIRVPGGIGMIDVSENTFSGSQQDKRSNRKHYSVAVGGTFDHLHAGHKLLLNMTAFMLESSSIQSKPVDRTLTIGITGDELLRNKKFAGYMQSWDERQKGVLDFLISILDFSLPSHVTITIKRVSESGPNGKAVIARLEPDLRIRCVEISDPFGPTITDESISALVISAETRAGGKAVNEKRREKGWKDLEVFEVDVLDAEEEGDDEAVAVTENFTSKISSTEIRRRRSEKSQSGV